MELGVEFEYLVAGRRIGLLLWKGPELFPLRRLLVGFEVESSWRTRQHIKGDLPNLVGPSAGARPHRARPGRPKGRGHQRRSQSLVQQHAPGSRYGEEGEVAALAEGEAQTAQRLVAELPAAAFDSTDAIAAGGSRYVALSERSISPEYCQSRNPIGVNPCADP